jgi:hypothetical protein
MFKLEPQREHEIANEVQKTILVLQNELAPELLLLRCRISCNATQNKSSSL